MRASKVIKDELDEQVAIRDSASEKVAAYQSLVAFHDGERDKCSLKNTAKKRQECTSTQQGHVNSFAALQADFQRKLNTANELINILKEEYEAALAQETQTAAEVSRELATQGKTVDSVFNETVEQGTTDRFELDLDKEARQQGILIGADATASKNKLIGYSIMAVAVSIAVAGFIYIIKKSKKEA